ncbi:DUF4238 domain-containing protein [Kitasatospora sp. NPDC088351]|uniref:DUF4238 domain-containing protein n=1 Tax=Kitasatospora sp. NPDC088351 TaxID=3155180 RepID=UPI00342533D6
MNVPPSGPAPEPVDIPQLIARVLELSAEPERPVHRQHVVSQVLLKRFATPQRRAGLRVGRFDLHYPERRHKDNSSAGFGWIEEFVPFGSGSIEKLWQDTENRLSAAFDALDDGTLLTSSRVKATLRDTVALHFVRSLRVRRIHQSSWRRVHAERRLRLLTDDANRVRRAALAEHGLHLAGPAGLEYFVDLLMKPATAMYECGALFRTALEDSFAQARAHVADASLCIITAEEGEFLIGDDPAITVRYTVPQHAVFGVPLMDSSTILLPLGPHHLVALANKDRILTVPKQKVDELNRLQIQAAERHVHHRPGEAITRFIRQTCADSKQQSTSSNVPRQNHDDVG